MCSQMQSNIQDVIKQWWSVERRPVCEDCESAGGWKVTWPFSFWGGNADVSSINLLLIIIKSSSCWYISHVTFLLLLFLTLSWLNVLIICSLDSELFLLRCVSASARPPTINASSVDSLIFRSIRLADVKSVSQLTRVITVMRPRKGFRVWAQFSE